MSDIMTFTLVNHRHYFYYNLITKNPIVKDIVKKTFFFFFGMNCEKDFISKLIEFLYKHMR